MCLLIQAERLGPSTKVKALALRVIADRLENGEDPCEVAGVLDAAV
jgi:hypothetical protein